MIELVFVIVILGILAAIAVPRLSQTKATAQENAVKTNVDTCVKAARLAYFEDTASVDTDAEVQALEGCKEINDNAKCTVTVSGTTLSIGSATGQTCPVVQTYPLN